MKKTTKRAILIGIVAAAVLAVAITGTVMFMQDSGEADAKGFTNQTNTALPITGNDGGDVVENTIALENETIPSTDNTVSEEPAQPIQPVENTTTQEQTEENTTNNEEVTSPGTTTTTGNTTSTTAEPTLEEVIVLGEEKVVEETAEVWWRNITLKTSIPDIEEKGITYTTDIEATKTNSVEANSVKVGDTFTYTIKVENKGNIAKEIQIIDPIPEELKINEATLPENAQMIDENVIDFGMVEVLPGQPIEYSFEVEVIKISTEPIQNIAEMVVDEENIPVEDEEIPTYGYTLEKTASLHKKEGNTIEGKAQVGDTIFYTISIVNMGSTDIENLEVYDPMYHQEVIKINIASGETKIIPYTYTVTQADIDNQTPITNVVTAGDKEDTTTTEVEEKDPSIKVVKKADKTEGLQLGDIVTYTITITNDGNVTLNNIALEDIFKEALALELTDKDGNIVTNIATMAPDESTMVYTTYTVTQEDIDKQVPIVNSATATADDGTTDTGTETVTVEELKPHITITKVADKTEGLQEGDIVAYTITVTNDGNTTLHNVTVTDIPENNKKIFLDPTKPEEKTNIIVSKEDALTLIPNESKTYTVYYKVEAEDVENVDEKDSLTNIAETIGYYEDEQKEEKYVEDDDPETIQFKKVPDGTIVKTQTVNGITLSSTGKILDGSGKETQNYPIVLPGTVVDYTITIENTGNTKLTNVVVTDTMHSINQAQKNVTIQSVTVNGQERDYTIEQDGSVRIAGEMQIDDILVITANYTVQETDVAQTQQNIIKNTATFTADGLPEKESTVEIPTTIWATNITYGKTGTLADGSDAHTKTVQYGDTITYTISAKNTGTKAGTQVLQDTDIKTMVEKAYITAPEKIVVKDFDEQGNARTNKITTDVVNVLNNGVTVYLPADATGNKVASITFTVQVIAAPGTTISNAVVGKEDEPVINIVTKDIEVTATEYKDKNIVVVLDLSSSMLKVSGTDEYPADCVTKDSQGRITSVNVAKLNTSIKTKLYSAKVALKQFIDDVLNYNPNNKITLITFNYDTFNHAKAGLNHPTYNYYWARIKNETSAHPYMKTQQLVKASNSKTTLKNAIDNIYLTYPLLTNVVSALELTQTKVNALKAAEPNKDIEVVFIGDGKPSYTSEPCAVGANNTSAGFYNKQTTFTKIEEIANNIKYVNATTKQGTKAHIYTLEYDVPDSEKADAKTTFNSMSTGASYRYSATASDLAAKLKQIGNAILEPQDASYTTDANGKVIIPMENGTTLRVEGTPVTPLTITIDRGEKNPTVMTFNSIAEINQSQGNVIEYTNNQLIIHVDKLAPDADISVNYYYRRI